MRVIAVESFTDASGEWHQYGHEFEMADTSERTVLIEAGIVREDDRRAGRQAAEPPAGPAGATPTPGS